MLEYFLALSQLCFSIVSKGDENPPYKNQVWYYKVSIEVRFTVTYDPVVFF